MNTAAEFKKKLHAGKVCVGSWVNSTDPCITEIMCGSGYDFLFFDAEHSALNIETIQLHMIATKATGVAPIVRVPWNDQVLIKRVLDVGAAGVLIPMVRTAEDARYGVSACKYPPEGVRGFGPRRHANYERDFAAYIERANREMIVFVQIEHVDAVENIEEILKVPGLDGVLSAACDLSGSMGILGQVGDARVREAIEKVIAKAHQAGVPAGLAGPRTAEAVFKWTTRGVQFITMGNDQGFLTMTSDNAVAELRKLLREGKDPG